MIKGLLLAMVILLVGYAGNALAFKLIERHLDIELGRSLRRRFYMLFRLLVPLFLLLLVVPALPLPIAETSAIRRISSVTFILLMGWLSVRVVQFGRDVLLQRYDLDTRDNLKARAVHTQANILVKLLIIAIALVTTASCLMIFENVRQVGTSILASAGVIGIIIGFAAQRSIATFLAGLQLAIIQPIRIDDVVIVDGEWGQIEEITLTYVVIRIWDLRRLVVPTSAFLEKSFQNWTRTSADLLGTVMIHADYRLPVDAVRAHLYEIIKDHELWDGKVWRLHVTNAGEQTIELRALMSVANSADGWELRCHVREQLLSFLQHNYPDCLPRLRAEIVAAPD